MAETMRCRFVVNVLVKCDDGRTNIPERASLTIDRVLADRILALAEVAERLDAHEITQMDEIPLFVQNEAGSLDWCPNRNPKTGLNSGYQVMAVTCSHVCWRTYDASDLCLYQTEPLPLTAIVSATRPAAA